MSEACPFSASVLQEFSVDPDESVQHTLATHATLRARCPVAHTNDLGAFWALATYDDVARVAADYTQFTTSVQNVVPKVAFTGRRPPLHLDPPDHTIYRAAVNPLLAMANVVPLEPHIRRIVRALLQPLCNGEVVDISAALGSVFPVQVFAVWMQLPADLEAQLMQAGPAFVQAVEAADAQAMRSSSLVLYEMARCLIALRKREPLDPATDAVTALLQVRADGKTITDEMILGTVRQILVVGIVAPMVLTGSIFMHLAEHPEHHRMLRADPSQAPAAMEEFLRLYTPYRGFARTARQDITIGGRAIAAGEAVALLYTSANRDEAVFDAPDEFRLNRPNIGDHLAFGRGPHYCAGANLGRLEMTVMLEEVLALVARVEIAGPVLSSPYPEIGPRSVPVRLHAV